MRNIRKFETNCFVLGPACVYANCNACVERKVDLSINSSATIFGLGPEEKYLELITTNRVLFSREIMPGHLLLGTPTKKLEGFDWIEVATLHPTYSSDFASSDYHLFTSVAPARDRTPCQTMTIGYNGLHVAY